MGAKITAERATAILAKTGKPLRHLAHMMGVSPQSVMSWKRNGARGATAALLLAIEVDPPRVVACLTEGMLE